MLRTESQCGVDPWREACGAEGGANVKISGGGPRGKKKKGGVPGHSPHFLLGKVTRQGQPQ